MANHESNNTIAAASMASEFRRGYKPLIGALIGAGCGLASICFYTNSVFVGAISSEMGWSRGATQAGVSIMILMAIITAPIAGWMIDRYSARRVALISLPLFAVSMASLSLVTADIWTFYAGWAIMSIVGAGTLPITWTKLVNEWFDTSRGLALGLTLAGTGIAATAAPTYVAWLIDTGGWRYAYVILGVTLLCISLPAVYFFFHEPKVEQPQAETITLKKLHSGVSLREGLTSYHFWVLAIGILLVAISISGVITNLVPLLTDRGLSVSQAASYAGLIGLSVIGGRVIAGFLMDHLWAPLIAAVFLGMPCIAAILLAGDSLTPFTISLAALIVGLAAGAELDLMAFLVSRYFGLKNYGGFYGGIYIFFSLGAGLAPALFGLAFDSFGNYQMTLNAVAVASLVGAALMLTLGRYPKFD